MTGTALHGRIMAFDYGDDERRAIMHKVWQSFPWAVDVYTGGFNISAGTPRAIGWLALEQSSDCIAVALNVLQLASWPHMAPPSAIELPQATKP